MQNFVERPQGGLTKNLLAAELARLSSRRIFRGALKSSIRKKTHNTACGSFFVKNQSLISTLTRLPQSAAAAFMTVRMALAMRP